MVEEWPKIGANPENCPRTLCQAIHTKRVLYNKSYGGFGFSQAFLEMHGITEDDDIDTERSSKRAFETIEHLGQSICTSAPFVCEDIELCQRLDLQTLAELVHTQRFREKHANPAFEYDLRESLKRMQEWPAGVVQAARAYYDSEGARYWTVFCPEGGPLPYSANCTFAEHIKLKKTPWPLHEAFRVSGIAGGCLIAASFREKMEVLPAAAVAAGRAIVSPQLMLGLAAASDVYAALGYVDVPELADYKIHEYDGKEDVVW